MEEIDFSNINALVLIGGGKITIQKDGTIKGAIDAARSGHKLVIRGGGGVNNTFISNGSGTSIVMGNSTFISNGSGTSIVMGNMTFNNSSSSNIITINGRRVDLNKLDDITEKDDSPAKVFRLDDSCSITSVCIKGSASLSAIPLKFTGDVFNASIPGSGTVKLPTKHFATVVASIAGSGDVKGSETSADVVTVNVSGTGDVGGIYVAKSGMVDVAGSGDVRLTAADPDQVMKNRMGSGSICVWKK